METLVSIFHVVISIFLILVVLIQSGRGGGFGMGTSSAGSQIFGGHGASTFLVKVTTVVAVLFFLSSLSLSYLSSHQGSVLTGLTGVKPTVPAAAPAAAPEAAPIPVTTPAPVEVPAPPTTPAPAQH